jgi:hypothetical protein
MKKSYIAPKFEKYSIATAQLIAVSAKDGTSWNNDTDQEVVVDVSNQEASDSYETLGKERNSWEDWDEDEQDY